MKNITRFVYLRSGTKYSGCVSGHLTSDQIQKNLLNRGIGCQRVLSVAHFTVFGG